MKTYVLYSGSKNGNLNKLCGGKFCFIFPCVVRDIKENERALNVLIVSVSVILFQNIIFRNPSEEGHDLYTKMFVKILFKIVIIRNNFNVNTREMSK